jgi:DNA-binding CsgD family transcriptional regulator
MAALVDGLDDGESENTEAWAVRSGQERFPCEVTVTRVKVADETVYHLILVDRSETEELKETLERERKHIREMSVTLKNVIKSVDEDKQEFMENLAHNVEIELVPALDKMSREESGPVRDDYKEVIEDKLRGLANGTSGRLNNLMMKLTPTEIQVCKYIQAGHGTKEIADMMSSSFETVQTHRKNIRKKLELTGRQVSLSTFLRTLPEADES